MLHLRHFVLLLCLPGSLAFACPPLAPERAAALSLEDVLARVQACHAAVRVAGAALAGADADRIVAGQRPNPQLTLGAGSISRRDGVGNGSLWSKTFDHQARIDQLIERGDKLGLRRANAQALLDGARADSAEAVRQARLEAGSVYLDLSAALARQQENAAAAQSAQDAVQAVERRVKAGDAPALDARRFAMDAVRVQADLRQAEAELQSLRWQLASLIGAEGLADQLMPTGDFSQVPDPAATALPSLEARPDVAAARARLEAAEQAQALAQAQRTRDVSVGAQFSRYPVSNTNTSGTGNTVSFSVTLPLFLRHSLDGEIARALADVDLARETLRKVRLAAESDLAHARAEWRAAEARRALLTDELLPAAESVSEGAELAYRRGASGVLEVLDARRGLRAARIDRINAELDRAKAALQLQSALQTQ